MTTSPNLRPNSCPRCGAQMAEHARLGFCSRCLAAISLAEAEIEAASEDDLAAVLPKTVAPSRKETRFGDYELLEEIARGGMGVVYRARQRSLNRIVAVKMLLFGGLAGPEKLRRFRAEAAAAAALDHPNIVRILDAGDQDGQPFLAMEYVAGRDLAQLVSNRPLPARQAAGYVQKITRAIAFAHAHGVLHRDLKPSNVLINAFDEPQLTDFGLARQLAADSDLTHSGQVLGSPNFMPPEQCGVAADKERNSTPEIDDRFPTSSGTNPRFGPWSDVYGLGAVLYHLLTGRPPFLADTFEATLRHVLEHEPVPPRQLNPQIPRDLETICLKCLEKEPAKRYGSAQALEDDLGRLLSDEPIRARPIGPTARLWRWCRRKPALASALLLVVLLVLVVAIGSPIAAYRINQERRKAEAQAYTSDMNVVQQAWDEGNLRRAQALLRAHIPKPGEPDLRGFEWRYLWKLCQDESRYTFTNFIEGVVIQRSPRGSFVAAAGGRVIKLLDPEHAREIGTLLDEADTNTVDALAFARDATNVLAATSGRSIKIWNLATRKVVARLEQPSDVTWANLDFLALSTDSQLLAAGDRDQNIALWDLGTRTIRWTVKTQPGIHPGVLTFTPDGRGLISGGGEGGNPLLWDARTGERTPFPTRHQGWIYCAEFSADGRWLATGGHDNTIIVWDVRTREAVARFVGHNGFVSSATFSPDGQYVATGGGVDCTIRLWHVPTQRQAALYRGHLDGVSSIAFSHDGRLLISGCWDRTVKVWNVEPGGVVQVLRGQSGWTNWIHCVAFSPDGRRLASTEYHTGLVRVWDVTTGGQLTHFTGWNGYAVDVEFSRDGKLLAAGVTDNTVRLWDAESFVPRGIMTNDSPGGSICFAPNSRILLDAFGGFELDRVTNRLTFWDSATGGQVHKLAAAAPEAHYAAFSNDGRLVAVGYFDGTVRLWGYETEKLLGEFSEQRAFHNYIWALTFNRDDTLLVAGDEAGFVRFYDVARRTALPPQKEHLARVWRIVFAPDGRSFATCSDDGMIKLWNVVTRQPALTLRSHVGPVAGIAFSSDGRLMASCGADGTVRLWPAASFGEIQQPEAGKTLKN